MRTHFPYLAAIAALFTSSSALAQNDGILRLGDLQSPNEAAGPPTYQPATAPQVRPVVQAPARYSEPVQPVQPQSCTVRNEDGSVLSGPCSAVMSHTAPRPAPLAAPAQQQFMKDCGLKWEPDRNGWSWDYATCTVAEVQAQLNVPHPAARTSTASTDPVVNARSRMQRNAVVNGLIADLGHTLIGAAGSHLYRGGYGYSRGYYGRYGNTGTGVYNYDRAPMPMCVGPYGSYAC